MRALTLLAILAALGVATLSLWTAHTASRDATAHADAQAALETRLAALEQALAARDRQAVAPAPMAAAAPATTADATGSGAPVLAPGARPATTTDLERRLAALERRTQGGRGADGAPAEAPPAPQATTESVPAGFSPWIGSVDDATRVLELSPSQRADVERVIADAKRDVDALRKTADDTGQTWETVEKTVLTMENGAISFDGSKLAAFRERIIPGRSESFGGAMRRIREDAKRRVEATLSPAQREKFAKTPSDGLLPGAGDNGGFGFVTFGAIGAGVDVVAPSEPDAAMDAK